MNSEPFLTLSQLNGLIRGAIDRWTAEYGEVAVIAEISEIRRGPTGHYYLRLVERTERGIVAELAAVIWAGAARTVETFRQITGKPLAAGMAVLLRGRVTFHERYGLKLEIRMVDPAYTLGQMQKERLETIARLEREGLMHRNKLLSMPLVPQRIAVIASVRSAGFQDFVHQLGANPFGYSFQVVAIDALMQGDEAPASVAQAFAAVAESADAFDAVALIRGGGSQVDLSCFDSYEIASAVALCPLPVVTGLGHERDESVTDMVAHTRAKTPTAAAEVFVGAVRRFEERVEEMALDLADGARGMLEEMLPDLVEMAGRMSVAGRRASVEESERLGAVLQLLAGSTLAKLRVHAELLDQVRRRLWLSGPTTVERQASVLAERSLRLRLISMSVLEQQTALLDRSERELRHLDPARVLARGFSITRCGGKAIRRSGDAPVGSVVETVLASGRLMSTVTRSDHEERNDDLRTGDGTFGGDSPEA